MMTIKKVEDRDLNKTMKSLEGFHPVLCKQCKKVGDFDIRLFIPSRSPDTAKEFESVRKKLAPHGVQDFGVYNTGRRSILVAALCKNCSSDKVLWDYCADCSWVKKHLQ